MQLGFASHRLTIKSCDPCPGNLLLKDSELLPVSLCKSSGRFQQAKASTDEPPFPGFCGPEGLQDTDNHVKKGDEGEGHKESNRRFLISPGYLISDFCVALQDDLLNL